MGACVRGCCLGGCSWFCVVFMLIGIIVVWVRGFSIFFLCFGGYFKL